MMAPLAVARPGDGVLVFQSELWATNSVLVATGDACLICDPSIFPDEISEIRAGTGGYARTYVLITHSDFDHVCGVPSFGDGVVVAGTATARAIDDGTARRKLDEAGRDWGTAWEGSMRVDVVLGEESTRCGDVEVAAIESSGHIDDGVAFVVPDRGLLLPGDYLSAVCPPIVLGSAQAAVATNERLLRALDDHAIRIVVPGHGPVLDDVWARRIACEDIAYLRALQVAAAEAVVSGISGDAAVAGARAVPPPRPARPDLAALGLLSSNAHMALAEAGHPAFAAPVTP